MLGRAVDLHLRSWLLSDSIASCSCVGLLMVSKGRRVCGDDMMIRQGRPPTSPPAATVGLVYRYHSATDMTEKNFGLGSLLFC